MVYVYGICIWHMYMVYVYGICIWYMYMVTSRGPVGPALGRGSQRLVTIYIYHIHIPYTYTIYVYHVHIPYTYTTYIYHIHIPYTYTIYIYHQHIPYTMGEPKWENQWENQNGRTNARTKGLGGLREILLNCIPTAPLTAFAVWGTMYIYLTN